MNLKYISIELHPIWQKATSEDVAQFYWQLQELRVSLFAQELKTPYPVSVKRLWKEFESF